MFWNHHHSCLCIIYIIRCHCKAFKSIAGQNQAENDVMLSTGVLFIDLFILKKAIQLPQKGAHWVMKDYNRVCALAACICLTGDKPCSNYCYLQS